MNLGEVSCAQILDCDTVVDSGIQEPSSTTVMRLVKSTRSCDDNHLRPTNKLSYKVKNMH